MSSKHFDHILHSVEHKRVWLNKTFLQAFLPVFLSTFALFIAEMIVGSPDKLPNWFNWVMFIVFTISISYSLVISQKRHLVGAYGETILILIPTFVWLLGGKFSAQKVLVIVSFIIIATGLFLVAISRLPFKVDKKNKDRARFRAQLYMRLAFVCSTTTATVVISLVLLNWADKSMHFATATFNPETKEMASDYGSTAWVTFIAAVTIVSAAALVMIGLTHSIRKEDGHFKKSIRKFKQSLIKKYRTHKHMREKNKKVFVYKGKKQKGYKKLFIDKANNQTRTTTIKKPKEITSYSKVARKTRATKKMVVKKPKIKSKK